MKYNFVTIEGNIGAGKTSLATMLANEFNAKKLFEEFTNNKYLPHFFEDISKYAFPTELFFMAERYQQLNSALQGKGLFNQVTITDYLFTKSLIFAKANLEDHEYQLYYKLFNIINPRLPKPDIVVYLYANIDRLFENINKRGRSFEKNITRQYLEKIQEGYLTYFKQQPKLTTLIVDVNTIDFVRKKEDYQKLKNLLSIKYDKGLNYVTI